MLTHTRTLTHMATGPCADSQETALEGFLGFIEFDLLDLLLLLRIKRG